MTIITNAKNEAILPAASPGHYQNWIYDFLCSDWLTQNQNIA